jgi:hypothetical protein
MAIILKANKVNLFVSSVLFVFWYHSPNFLDTPHIKTTNTGTNQMHSATKPMIHSIGTNHGNELDKQKPYTIASLLSPHYNRSH